MQKMAITSWISVYVLVISSAIPFAKRDGVKTLDDGNVSLTLDNDKMALSKSKDHGSSAMFSVSNHAEHEGFNNTEDQHEISNNQSVSITAEDGDTRKLHLGVRRIYHNYRERNRDVKDMNVLTSIPHILVRNLSSRNKTVPLRKIPFTKLKPADAEIVIKHKDHNVTLNKTDVKEQNQQKEQHEVQQEDENTEGELDENVENRQNTSNTDSLFTNVEDNTSPIPQENQTEESVITSCEHVTGYFEHRWLQMVVLCPNQWTDISIQTKCEFWEDLEPLTFIDGVTSLPVQDENGTVYANIYCAMCHEVAFFLPWTTSIDCNRATPETFHISESIDLAPLYSDLMSSKCEKRIIPSIPEALTECVRGPLQISSNTRKYNVNTMDVTASSYPVSFNILMNFDFTGNTHILFTASQTIIEEEYIPRCQDGKTYDPYIESCRQITCNKFFTLVDNKCVRSGIDYMSSDSITDLSQLRTVNIVTLQVNITFGDFLILKFKDTEPDIVSQIADQLSISVDRIKDVNFTYELGSINGSALQVTTMTEAEYRNLFPHHHLPNLTNDRLHHEAGYEESEETVDEFISRQHEVKYANSDSRSGNVPQDIDKESVNTNSADQTMYKAKSATMDFKSQYNAVHLDISTIDPNADQHQPGSSTPHIRQRPTETSKGKASAVYPATINVGWMSTVCLNFTRYNLFLNKKLRHQALKYSGTLVRTKYGDFFPYQFKSQNDDTNVYISAPVNEKNERICLLIRNSQNIQLILEQSIAMHISFLLVPPDDPLSSEARSINVLQRIDNLIVEQQFSLKLNGNKVDVVAVDDDRDRLVDEKEFCPWGVEYMVYNEEFMLQNKNNVTVMYVNKTNSYINVGLFDLYVFLSGSNNADQTNVTDLMQYAFVCFMPRISEKECNMINLAKEEYYVAGANKSIMFEGKEYDIFHYRVQNETAGCVQICVPPTFNNHDNVLLPHIVTIDNGCGSDFDGAMRAEGRMTLILGRVSTFAMSCVILTYLLFPALRNLPGLNLMNLTFCLLVAQIIFAEGIGENRDWLCQTVAISLHYSLLAAHFWMNVMSYDVYKTFTNPVMRAHIREKSKYFPRYALYAWGMPLIIVSLCVFIDFSNLFDGASIGYGDVFSTTDLSDYNYSLNEQDDVASSNNTSITDEHKIHSCWITQPLAALVAFGDIILIIFLVNCILFAKTIMCISKTAKITKKSVTTRHSNSSFQKLTDRSEVMLYLKMSTVMGFTWVFGLSSSILSSFVKPPTFTACAVIHFVGILFIILNTSQGFFIFIAFVCNRRVFGLYKNFLQKIKNLLGQSRRGSIFSISSSRTTLSPQTHRRSS